VIDLHSHILPGLDDGASDLDEAVEIARAAVQDGTRIIAATPHVREDYPTTSSAMVNGLAHLRRALDDAGIDLVVLPGGELSLEQLDRLGTDDLHRFGLGGNPSCLLLETPYIGWPPSFGDIVSTLSAAGIRPVIAHPERNDEVQENPGLIAELVRGGALVQLTAASLDGRLGRTTRATAEQLLNAELAHMVVSDAHGSDVREVGLSGARAAIGDEALARWLTEDVPQAILEGEDLPPRPSGRRRPTPSRGLLARLLGR
jgi:protein-tyrosine phosphatase